MSYADRCEVCSGYPKWALTRQGDVVVSWACPSHLDIVLDGLQRDHEISRIEVVLYPKAVEWNGIGRMLNEVDDATPTE